MRPCLVLVSVCAGMVGVPTGWRGTSAASAFQGAHPWSNYDIRAVTKPRRSASSLDNLSCARARSWLLI